MADDKLSCSDRNPSPPNVLIQDDIISGTVVEKHWVLKTILSAVKELSSAELDEEVEDELCKLWDISMDDVIVDYLIQNSIHTSLIDIATQSQSLRLTEICIGILGNLVCKPQICQQLSQIEDFTSITLTLLSSRDVPTLVQVLRILQSCLETRPANKLWLELIKNSNNILNNFLFILNSSSNENILEMTSQMIDNILDSDDEIVVCWAKNEMIEALIEGFRQLRLSAPSSCDNFCHIFQLLSTVETGLSSILNHSKLISALLENHLNNLCSMDFVDLDGRHCGLASSIDLIEKLISTIDWKKSKFVQQIIALTAVIQQRNNPTTMDAILRDTLVSFWNTLLMSQIPSIFSTLDKIQERDLNALLKLLNDTSDDTIFEKLRSTNHNRLTQIVQTFCSSR